MNEKQSIQILKPPANSEIRSVSMDSVVEEGEASPVSNTLGTEPKQRSWCYPLQLGIPRGM